MLKKVTPDQAAAVMGCSPQFVRVAMQQGELNIGTAVKMSSVWTYNISPGQLAERQKITVKELEKMLEEINHN